MLKEREEKPEIFHHSIFLVRYSIFVFLTVVVVLTFLFPARTSFADSASERRLEFLFAITHGKLENDLLGTAGALALDEKTGEIYVCDSSNHRIAVFNNSGSFIAEYRNFGALPAPGLITLDERGNLLVTTGFTPLIVVLSPFGKLVETIDLSSLPGGGAYPGKIVIDDTGRRIVQDLKNMRIIVLDDRWKFLFRIGVTGAEKGGLDAPSGIALDAEGNIFIVDSGQKRISTFDGKGKFLRRFGIPGDGEGKLSLPVDLAISPDGNIYALDANRRVIIVFDGNGEYLYEKGWGGRSEGYFYAPYFLKISRDGLLYVSEPEMARVQVFKLELKKEEKKAEDKE